MAAVSCTNDTVAFTPKAFGAGSATLQPALRINFDTTLDCSSQRGRITEISGRFALSTWRQQGHGIAYPNAIVEKQSAIPATTRNWNTIADIRGALEG